MESPKDEIVIKENSLYDNFDSTSNTSKRESLPHVIPIMTTNVIVEADMIEMGSM